MDYNVWFVVGDSSVSLYLLIPQYGYLASLTCLLLLLLILILILFQNVKSIITLDTIRGCLERTLADQELK